MKTAAIDTAAISGEEYWKYFQRLINSADAGTTLTTLSWILFWLDHIPAHVIHTHFVTGFMFLGALFFGIVGTRVMIQTRNRLGTKSDRFFHLVKISYTLVSSVTGILAYLAYPPH